MSSPTSAPTDGERSDIVIIGAGVSGLYCAWRLIEDDPTRRITVVERLNRTGGRLDSDLVRIDGTDQIREEEGGMRFNTSMTELMQLIEVLGLCDQVVPFPMTSAGDGHDNTNRFNLRGRCFTAAEAEAGGNAIWGEIYRLADDERGKSPSDLVMQAYTAVLAENHRTPPDSTPPEEWAAFRNECTWQGTLLRDWQMWGLLRSMDYSEECIEMLSETIGFAGPFKAPINAGDAFQILADFPKVASYLTLRDGFSTLPNALSDRLTGRVEILLETNVDRIERSGDDFALTLTRAPGGVSSNPYIPGGTVTTRTTGTVVLAVATAGLQTLFNTSPALNEDPHAHRLWDSISAATGMGLLKINLYYESAWWRTGDVTPPVRFGPNFTDLPLNAIYPFYSLSAGPPPDGDGSLTPGVAALTIYCDLDNTTFWSGLQHVGPAFDSPLQREHSVEPQTMFAASQAVVREAQGLLTQLFGVAAVPEPILTSYRFWDGTDDFEFAYHQWALGVDDDEVRNYLRAPINGIHVCNEAISDMHGWVNGSIRSTDLVLDTFGIPPLDNAPCAGPAASTAPVAAATGRPGLWGM